MSTIKEKLDYTKTQVDRLKTITSETELKDAVDRVDEKYNSEQDNFNAVVGDLISGSGPSSAINNAVRSIKNVNIPQAVKDCSYFFDDCKSLKTIEFANINTSNVTKMDSMFNNCSSLTSLDLSMFDTSNVTSMLGTFCNCSSLTSLDLSNFNTQKLTNMQATFVNCTSLLRLDLRNFDFASVSYHYNTFTNIPMDCEIIVKDDDAKSWVLNVRSDLTNVKTVAELEN